MLSFNLFRRRREPDIYCAVPEDRAVPDFLASKRWAFGGKADLHRNPPGFNPQVARTACQLNGFYVFQRF
jgi:hypothetical protein